LGTTRSSLALAFTLVFVTALGCSDETQEPTLLSPSSTLTTIDIQSDSTLVMDTATVSQGSTESLVGATVNDDGSITRDSTIIGQLGGSGPVGPTGTTGTGGGSGGGAGPGGDKASMVLPGTLPTTPQADSWCMVRIWYDLDTGEIVDAEILYCWDDGDGGSGGGGNNNNNNGQQVTFSLSCDITVTRGRTGSCSVSATNEDGEVDTEAFDFSSSSSSGATASGIGMDTWDGTAVEDVTVTVSVGEFTESKDISVNKRFNWRFNSVRASWVYDATLTTLGLYHLPSSPSRVPSASQGNGPWKGRYYMRDAPSPDTEIRVNDDYSSSGPRYTGARSTCSPNSNSLPSSASYHRVNTACQTIKNMTSFRNDILTHERDHESGINDCLTSSTAGRAAASRIEAVTGTSAGAVTSAAQSEWSSFYNGSLKSSGYRARAFTSGPAFHWNSSGWNNSYPGILSHPGGQHSC